MPFISAFDGWLNAEVDEPHFTLLARDYRAPFMVLQWAYERQRDIATGRKPESDRIQVVEARRIARLMQDWYRENRGEWAPKDKLKFGGTSS